MQGLHGRVVILLWPLYLKVPPCFFSCQLLDLWKRRPTVNQCVEERLCFSLKSPSLSDDATEAFAVAEYFAVAALNKQFFSNKKKKKFFSSKPFAEDPVSSVGGCPHRFNNQQQPSAHGCLYCCFLFWPHLARFQFSDLQAEDIVILYWIDGLIFKSFLVPFLKKK